jgi:hypothetical protein
METSQKGLIDFMRAALNEQSKELITEVQGIDDPHALYLFFCDKNYDISFEDCVKVIQARKKFLELNPPQQGTPPVTY